MQRAKEAAEAVVAAAWQLKRSLLRHLFTYGPVPVDQADRVPVKETEIGPIPEHWELLVFAELFESRLGKMLSQAARAGQHSRPYLRNANVQWGRVVLDDVFQMDFDDQERAEFLLRPGDVLICDGGEVGRTAIWRGELAECYFQKAIHRARLRDSRMTAEFLLYHMTSAFLVRDCYGVVGTTTTIPHLPGVKLKRLLVPVPPRTEQDDIVTSLATTDKKIAAEESRVSALGELFRSLLRDLMTGRVRVGALDLSPGHSSSSG